ncbi:MAG: ribonuclease D [Fimbriimonadaceae bacterium]|nr:ribonuclease D [Fimbriimonadaceae bacterium]
MLIETTAHLAAACATWRQAPAVFIDTEFVGEGRYYPRLGTVQVGTADPASAALIDAVKVSDLTPLGELLTDRAVTKVFHAAGQDLRILYRLFDAPIAPLFDTQVAARLVSREEQISFDNLVERLTGQRPAEGHGFTDWLRRPLSPGQIAYALDDVRLLAPVYDALQADLTARGRLDWAAEEFAPLEDPPRHLPVDPREQYLRIRGLDRLNGQALAALRELAAWREETARREDLPVPRLARDEVLLELARRPRHSPRELREVRGLTPPQADRWGSALLAAAQRGWEGEPLPRIRRAAVDPALDPTVDFLTLCLRALAEELSLAAGLLANRDDLQTLAHQGADAAIALLRGWRRQAVGERLLATLAGDATARIRPGTRQVELRWHA